jgi:hypothetical protein
MYFSIHAFLCPSVSRTCVTQVTDSMKFEQHIMLKSQRSSKLSTKATVILEILLE